MNSSVCVNSQKMKTPEFMCDEFFPTPECLYHLFDAFDYHISVAYYAYLLFQAAPVSGDLPPTSFGKTPG